MRMKNAVNIGRSLVIITLLLSFASGFSQVDPQPSETYSKDGIAVKSYNYESFKALLEKNNDSTYVVNFWATWCAPCVQELPHFEKLNSEYKNKKVSVLLVSLDFKKQVEKNLLPFIKRRNLKSKVVLLSDPDMNAWISKVNPDWSGAIPATVIYNKNQRKFYEQSFTYEQLESEVKPFIE